MAVNPLLIESGFTLPDGLLKPGTGPHAELATGLSAEEYYAKLTEQPDDQEPPEDEPGPGESDDEQSSESDDQEQSDDQAADDDSNSDNSDNPNQSDDDQGGNGTPTDNPSPDADSSVPSTAPDTGRCGSVTEPKNADGTQAEAADQNQLDQEWTTNVAAAQQAAEIRGEMPGGLARLIGEILAPATDWKAELREFITRPAKTNYNWQRPNRRFVHAGIYLPSMHSLEIGHIIAAIDTSGSIGQATLIRFASELADICTQGINRLTILYHDSQIAHVQEWTPEDGELILEPAGGGGTDHNPVFEWIDQNTEEPPAVLVCLTDLCSSFPETAPEYPVLWASTEKNQPHPFGERLNIPAE